MSVDSWGPLTSYRRLARILGELEGEEWRADAACRETELPTSAFFPGRGESGEAARAVCARCPVDEPCLALALATNASGIWGGTSEAERRRLRRAQRAA